MLAVHIFDLYTYIAKPLHPKKMPLASTEWIKLEDKLSLHSHCKAKNTPLPPLNSESWEKATSKEEFLIYMGYMCRSSKLVV